MPKRKREVEDSDDIVESSKKVKDQLRENEDVISKPKKKKKNKQTSVDATDEWPVLDASSEDEENLSQSQKKKKKKNKQQSPDITDEEDTRVKDVSSENEESVSLSSKKKKKKKKRKSEAEKEANSPNRESDEPQEKSAAKPSNPTAQKKASMSKGFVLFVGQIPHHIKQKDLEKHFSTIGGVKEVRLLIYEDSQRPRGCAYVEFVDNQHRKAALKLNGSTLGRAKIKVEYPYQGGKRYGGAKKNKSKEKNWKGKNE